MIVYIVIAVLNGFLTVINKMVNIRAKQCLGMANGTLINYLEASVISFVLVLVLQRWFPLHLENLAQAPAYLYVGGAAGVIAMVLTIKGMERCPIVLSTVLVLAGQLGIAVVLDSIFYRNLTVFKIIGIALVILGITLNKRAAKPAAADRPQ